jgi:hypothetical protein
MTRLCFTKGRPGLSSEKAPRRDKTTNFTPKHLTRKQYLLKRPQSGLDTKTYWLTVSRKVTLSLTDFRNCIRYSLEPALVSTNGISWTYVKIINVFLGVLRSSLGTLKHFYTFFTCTNLHSGKTRGRISFQYWHGQNEFHMTTDSILSSSQKALPPELRSRQWTSPSKEQHFHIYIYIYILVLWVNTPICGLVRGYQRHGHTHRIPLFSLRWKKHFHQNIWHPSTRQ